MLVVFAVGIERIEVYGGCVLVSILIHYFSLVSVMWMGAEALLMFQKLVIVFMAITTKFIVILSLVCWCKLACTGHVCNTCCNSNYTEWFSTAKNHVSSLLTINYKVKCLL